MKLIKINDSQYIIVDDVQIEKGDWYIDTSVFSNKIYQMKYQKWGEEGQGSCKKITHSTEPLEVLRCRCKYGSIMTSSHPCKKECQNPRLGFVKIKQLNLSEV